MKGIGDLRVRAQEARSRGDNGLLLQLVEQLLVAGDEGEPVGLNACRAGVLYLDSERWLKGTTYLRRAHKCVQPGTALHAEVLHNLALGYLEMEAPITALSFVDEYMRHFSIYPTHAQDMLGRMFQHRAEACEIVDPAVAPDWYAEAVSHSARELRQIALIDRAWALLSIEKPEESLMTYNQVNPDELGELGRFAHASVGAFLMKSQGKLDEAERLRVRALALADGVHARTRKRGLLILLGAEIRLALGLVKEAEDLGSEAAGLFRRDRRLREYAEAQEFLTRVVRCRLA